MDLTLKSSITLDERSVHQPGNGCKKNVKQDPAEVPSKSAVPVRGRSMPAQASLALAKFPKIHLAGWS